MFEVRTPRRERILKAPTVRTGHLAILDFERVTELVKGGIWAGSDEQFLPKFQDARNCNPGDISIERNCITNSRYARAHAKSVL